MITQLSPLQAAQVLWRRLFSKLVSLLPRPACPCAVLSARGPAASPTVCKHAHHSFCRNCLPFFTRWVGPTQLILFYVFFGVCMCVCAPCICLSSSEAKRSHRSPWNWSYSQLWTGARMLEIELRSSGRTASALHR